MCLDEKKKKKTSSSSKEGYREELEASSTATYEASSRGSHEIDAQIAEVPTTMTYEEAEEIEEREVEEIPSELAISGMQEASGNFVQLGDSFIDIELLAPYDLKHEIRINEFDTVAKSEILETIAANKDILKVDKLSLYIQTYAKILKMPLENRDEVVMKEISSEAADILKKHCEKTGVRNEAYDNTLIILRELSQSELFIGLERVIPNEEEKKSIDELDAFTALKEKMWQDISGNMMLSTFDKKQRMYELFHVHMLHFEEKKGDFVTADSMTRFMLYQTELEELKNEVLRMKVKKIEAREDIAILTQRLSELQANGARRACENLSAKLEQLISEYKLTFSCDYKKDLMALDGSEEKDKCWEADETLTKNQEHALAEIDRWMLSKASDDYKDKLFMQKVLGLTRRERLAMYMLVEIGVSNMDYGALIFSQADYVPNLSKIMSKMYGYSLIRRLGIKRIHWGDVRRAFEFVSGKSDDIDELARLSVAERDKVNAASDSEAVYGIEDEQELEEAMDLGVAMMADDQASSTATESEGSLHASGEMRVTAEEIKASTMAYIHKQQEIIEACKKGKTDNLDDAYEELKNLKFTLVGQLRNQAGSKKDSAARAMWKGYCDFVEKYDKLYGYAKYLQIGGNIAALFVEYPYSEAGAAILGQNVTFAAIDPLEDLAVTVMKIGNLASDWKNKSTRARIDASLGVLAGLNKTVKSADFLITGAKKSGFTIEGIFAYSKSKKDKIAERVADGKSAFEFSGKTQTVCQCIGTGITLASAFISYQSAYKSGKARRQIRDQISHRVKSAQGVDAAYRDDNYRKTLSGLVRRINTRKIISTTTNVICDAAGYLKYLISYTGIATVTSAATSVIKLCAKGVDMLLKRKSDYSSVDDFLDLDTMIASYRANNPLIDTQSKDFRKRFRKMAMLELGFANTKQFFTRVARKLAEFIHNVIFKMANGNRRTQRDIDDTVQPYINLLNGMGLRVSLPQSATSSALGYPSVENIAKKLAA